jgi:hypothetical protein
MVKESKLKRVIKKSYLYQLLCYYRKIKANRKAESKKKNTLKQWHQRGRPIPPPHIYKLSVIKQYASLFQSPVFIETGTFLGETTEACKHLFKKLITIELDQKLYENACNKFSNEKNISIYQGDSGQVLESVMVNISQPCLFWLDGHYSEGITAKGELNTPIINELKIIFNPDR